MNYMKEEGKSLQDYALYIGGGLVLLYFIGTQKTDTVAHNTAQDAIKLGEGLCEDKLKRGELKPGTKYFVGPYCDLKVHDGQPKHYVASCKIINPDSEVVHSGIKVDYLKPGNPRMFKSIGELRGNELQPTVYLPGRLAQERKKFPWLFGRGGG